MNVSCNFAFNLFKDSPPHCALIRSFEFNAHTAKIKLLKELIRLLVQLQGIVEIVI